MSKTTSSIRPAVGGRPRAALFLTFGMACALSGCEVVEPDGASDTSAATAPSRPVSTACNVSPTVLAGAPVQVNGAFCFGVSQTSSTSLRCAQRTAAISECIDELANLAYLVGWTGNDGTVFDYTTGKQVYGTLKVVSASAFEVSVVASATPSAAPRAAGLCSLTVEAGRAVAKYCPYVD